MGFILSPLARADLEDIWNYTCERWGVDQAGTYVELIRDAIVSAAENPRLGRACEEIRSGYFRFPAGSHIIFYRRVGADIDIVRILHGRMDIRRHL